MVNLYKIIGMGIIVVWFVILDAICDGREMFETPVSSFSRLGSGQTQCLCTEVESLCVEIQGLCIKVKALCAKVKVLCTKRYPMHQNEESMHRNSYPMHRTSFQS